MLKHLRQTIVAQLWQQYRSTSLHMQRIEQAFSKKNIQGLFLDHFALIDLPGPHTGIAPLSQLFSLLGFIEQGKDYLAAKQNDFLWMAASDNSQLTARDALPQVVVADFRLDELPLEVKRIVEKYANKAPPSPLGSLEKLIAPVLNQDAQAVKQASHLIMRYLSGRDWPLPFAKEYYTVKEFNELLAWVLVFGRKPNHFTLSIHLLNHFTDLSDFHCFIEEEAKLKLNQEGGAIKGSEFRGIAQGSTIGTVQRVSLADEEVFISTEFVEFVWRYPRHVGLKPLLWKEYFTGFIAQHADNVIESLYLNS